MASCPEPRAWDQAPRAVLPALPALAHLWEAEGGSGTHLSSQSQVPTCLSEVDRAWSHLRPHLEAPPTCHVPPAPACLPGSLALGRFQCLKIALEETQVWGLRREMSLGRAASSTPRRTGGRALWAGNTPRGACPRSWWRARACPQAFVPRCLALLRDPGAGGSAKP